MNADLEAGVHARRLGLGRCDASGLSTLQHHFQALASIFGSRGNCLNSRKSLRNVCFLANRPGKDLVAGLDAGRSTPDAFAVVGREIYMQLANGVSGTKLTNAYFDSKLKTVSTMRNWRTVLKLADMMS